MKSGKTSKKLITLFIIMMILGIGTYVYFPHESLAEEMRAFMIMAFKSRKEQVFNIASDKIFSSDSDRREKVLFSELKDNLEAIKKINKSSSFNSSFVAENFSFNIGGIIDNSEEIINELETEKSQESISSRMANKILNVILPEDKKSADCQISN